MKFFYKRSYLKTFDHADFFTQGLIREADKVIKDYFETGQSSYGLRIKKIGAKTFEGRVTDKIRIVWIKEGNAISFVMVGDHEEVQNYLKNFEI